MKSSAIVPFQNNSRLALSPRSRRSNRPGGGRRQQHQIGSNLLHHAPNVAASINRYFGIDLHNLPNMSDQQLAQFADRALQMKRLRETLPILDRHFQELIEGQLEYEQFVQKFLKYGGAAAQKIDKGVLDAYLLSQGYNNHLKLMSQESAQGSQKLNAEFQAASSLNQLDFQTSLRMVALRRQNKQQQIREKIPRYLQQQQLSEQQRLAAQQRRDLLTHGTQTQPRGGSVWDRVSSFFGGNW